MEVRRQTAKKYGPAHFNDCSMDLSKDLWGHRLGKIDARDLGAECRSKLFDLDMVVLCFSGVRHGQYIFGRGGTSIPGIVSTEHSAC